MPDRPSLFLDVQTFCHLPIRPPTWRKIMATSKLLRTPYGTQIVHLNLTSARCTSRVHPSTSPTSTSRPTETTFVSYKEFTIHVEVIKNTTILCSSGIESCKIPHIALTQLDIYQDCTRHAVLMMQEGPKGGNYI